MAHSTWRMAGIEFSVLRSQFSVGVERTRYIVHGGNRTSYLVLRASYPKVATRHRLVEAHAR